MGERDGLSFFPKGTFLLCFFLSFDSDGLLCYFWALTQWAVELWGEVDECWKRWRKWREYLFIFEK